MSFARGEETRSHHKQQLFRKIAWRIQELAEGGLSERAKARARQLANRKTRRDIQLETPCVLWDAAAEQGEFFVWRVDFGRSACMYCKHDERDDPEQEKAIQLAQALGLDAETWRRKIAENELFTSEELRQMRLRASDEDVLPKEGERYNDWAMDPDKCGRLKLPEEGGGIPMPVAPVMAGVLLAGEVVKERLFPRAALKGYYWNTLLGSFMRRNKPNVRAPRADCPLCQDEILLRQYRSRWSTRRGA